MRYLFLACWLLLVGQITAQATLSQPLRQQMSRFDGPYDVLLLLRQQANLSPARHLKGKTAKGTFVTQALRSAARQQVPLLNWLEQRHIRYQRHYLLNAIQAQLTIEQLHVLASRPELSHILTNQRFPLMDDQPDITPAISARDGIEWGIQHIGADLVWQMGYRGQEVVVGGADTGVDFEHPAIYRQYRGYQDGSYDHRYAWHDAIDTIILRGSDSIPDPALNRCGINVAIPCDDHGHGTHTIGTIVGDDSMGNQIGVAPEAKWIACRNMERGYGTPATYIECFEWFMAPYPPGSDPMSGDPAQAPHVINNSWGCPPSEGCNPDNFIVMQLVVDRLTAAGIVVVASAGNNGNSCGTIRNPAAIFEHSFTVGAINRQDSLAGFSSLGPVVVDSSFRTKPDVTAPGVQVRSCLPDSAYANFSGTSMAGPHVAGTIALMISANPALAGEVDLIEDILRRTARPMADHFGCSQPNVVNNAYGYGIIDAFAAVEEAIRLVDVADVAFAPFRLFPNPMIDQFQLELPQNTGVAHWELYDRSGQLLREQRIHSTITTLSVKGLPPGLYLYRIKTSDNWYSGKLVVQ